MESSECTPLTPDEWDDAAHSVDDADDKDAVLVRLRSGSTEYQQVMSVLTRDGSSVNVERIERVQARTLWTAYDAKRRGVAAANGGDANEQWLVHGTGSIPPEQLWGGVGFHINYASSRGFFGRAFYFAEDFGYSNSYRYNVPGGNKMAQMFVVRVAAGAVDQREAIDPEIKHPRKGCHSVRGPVTASHQAYMTYDSDAAYPAYLVTYQVN